MHNAVVGAVVMLITHSYRISRQTYQAADRLHVRVKQQFIVQHPTVATMPLAILPGYKATGLLKTTSKLINQVLRCNFTRSLVMLRPKMHVICLLTAEIWCALEFLLQDSSILLYLCKAGRTAQCAPTLIGRPNFKIYARRVTTNKANQYTSGDRFAHSRLSME